MTENTGTAAPTADTAQPAAPAAEPTNKPTPAAAPKPEQAPADDWLGDEEDVAEGAEGEADGAAAAADEGEKPDTSAYEYQPPEGTTLAPEAEGRIASFAEFAAKSGIAPDAFQGALNFYDSMVKEHRQQLVQNDKLHAQETTEALRETWGEEFDARYTVAKEGAKALPKSLKAAIREARLPDGRRLANLPEINELFYQLGRRSGTEHHDVAGDERRIKEIELARKTDIGDYYHRGLDVELTTLLGRRTARAAADKPTPVSGDAQREAEIMAVLRKNAADYYGQGLDKELAQIRARRGA